MVNAFSPPPNFAPFGKGQRTEREEKQIRNTLVRLKMLGCQPDMFAVDMHVIFIF